VPGVDVKELAIAHSWVFTPRQHGDDRGVFLEWFKAAAVEDASGRPFTLAQANHSVSKRGTLRGIHFADVPPGQGKYVYCPKGAVLDVIIDVRVGSPTYGEHATVRLDEVDRRGVFISEGLGHAFVALTDDANVTYLVSTGYNPTGEHGVHPLDPAIGIDWPVDSPVLSAKDAAAPTLAEAADQGLLPAYDDCVQFYDSLRMA
jgi:dTDP-4-dehydrorhamnose 3,5-epimerase